MSVALLLAAASASSSGWFQLDASAAARLAAGKAQLDELLAGSKAPGARGTQCWRDAVGALEGGCKALDDERQSRLAVAFANCHFLKSGLRAYDCADDVPLASCTAQMATEHNGMPFTCVLRTRSPSASRQGALLTPPGRARAHARCAACTPHFTRTPSPCAFTSRPRLSSRARRPRSRRSTRRSKARRAHSRTSRLRPAGWAPRWASCAPRKRAGLRRRPENCTG